MEFTIIEVGPEYATGLARFSQPIYAQTYPNAKYGLQPEHFSPEIFADPRTIKYYTDILTPSQAQQAYLAVDRHKNILGSIGVKHTAEAHEIRAFYVGLKLQGQGIGAKLMATALKACTTDLPVRVEVGETIPAIAIYQRWGFKIVPELGIHLRHWPGWPTGLQNGYIFMEARKEDIHV